MAELARQGAEAAVAACDVTDRRALAEALASHAADQPLVGVVHTPEAGPSPEEEPDAVPGPTADAAWHLHELTRNRDLALFVTFSSFTGPEAGGHGGDAAFLAALARHRRDQGLPGLSITWDDRSGDEPELSAARQMALFDRALSTGETAVAATRPNAAAMRTRPGSSTVRQPSAADPHRLTADNSRSGREELRQRLAELSRTDREEALTDVIREAVAAVLDHTGHGDIELDRPFADLGFDSLTAIELRASLQGSTGVKLPATLVFDHPDPRSLATELATLLSGPQPADGGGALAEHRDLFGELYLRSIEDGRPQLGEELMIKAARLRAKFDDAAGVEAEPAVVRISPAGEGPHLICVCPAIMTTGPQVYLRLAAELTGRGHQVSALVPPGFAAGELLPATRAALVTSMADTVQKFAEETVGTGFSLAGHSSGGVVAYELARELHTRGLAPAGLVLLDTYTLNQKGARGVFDDGPLQHALTTRLVEYMRRMDFDTLSERPPRSCGTSICSGDGGPTVFQFPRCTSVRHRLSCTDRRTNGVMKWPPQPTWSSKCPATTSPCCKRSGWPGPPRPSDNGWETRGEKHPYRLQCFFTCAQIVSTLHNVARIPYLTPATASDTVAEPLSKLPPLHLFGLMAHAETTFRPWLRFSGALLNHLALDPVLRELAILRVGQLTARYEWDQHVPVALAVGNGPRQA
ncbi:KR domain-containing protein [Streptomyces olivaceus]|uniref:KR domain-containing protein n=1 Tax=Streptomyces olivaceus TaxID=47716 RepID=UPI0036FC0D38